MEIVLPSGNTFGVKRVLLKALLTGQEQEDLLLNGSYLPQRESLSMHCLLMKIKYQSDWEHKMAKAFYIPI